MKNFFRKKIKYKYVLPLITLTLLLQPIKAFSDIIICTDNYKCPSPPYDIANPVSRGIQNVSGMNFIATKIAEIAVTNLIKSQATCEANVKIDSFSATDLKAGKFKGIEINAKNINFEDVYISSVNAKSICNFIHIDYEAKPLQILQPLNLKLKGTLSENDLNKTVASPKYLSRITKIKLNNSPFEFAQFKNPHVDLQNNRMILSAGLWLAGTPKNAVLPVKFNTGLKVNKGKIEFSDVKISTTGFLKINFNLPQSAYESINPVLYNLNNLSGSEFDGSKFNFEKIAIIDNKINAEGLLLLPKSSKKTKIR